MRATSSTLFVHVDTGITENAGMENGRKVTLENPKPTRIDEFNIKNIWHILPVPLSLKLSIRHSPPMSLCYTILNNDNTNNNDITQYSRYN